MRLERLLLNSLKLCGMLLASPLFAAREVLLDREEQAELRNIITPRISDLVRFYRDDKTPQNWPSKNPEEVLDILGLKLESFAGRRIQAAQFYRAQMFFDFDTSNSSNYLDVQDYLSRIDPRLVWAFDPIAFSKDCTLKLGRGRNKQRQYSDFSAQYINIVGARTYAEGVATRNQDLEASLKLN